MVSDRVEGRVQGLMKLLLQLLLLLLIDVATSCTEPVRRHTTSTGCSSNNATA